MAAKLRQHGFTRIRPLLGGLDAWIDAGMPIDGADGDEDGGAGAVEGGGPDAVSGAGVVSAADAVEPRLTRL